MSYATLKQNGFVQQLNVIQKINPRAIWIPNLSCKGAGVPDIVTWLRMEKNLANIYIAGAAKYVKPYLTDLRDSGKGNKDCAAVTLAVATWRLPEYLLPAEVLTLPKYTKDGIDLSLRRVLIGSGSLNQDMKPAGQVHAEDIATNIVIDAMPDVLAYYKWTNAELVALDMMIYPVDIKGSDFTPCGACLKTLAATLKPHKAKLGTVSMHGQALNFD